jgi:hypothetical protein
MRDSSTYRRFAQECQRLANVMPEEHRRTLLEIADAWANLAEDPEQEASPKKPRTWLEK